MHRYLRLLLGCLIVLVASVPSAAQAPSCADGVCRVRLTATELLRAAEQLVVERRFDEAQPILAALSVRPEFAMERQFLEGYIAAETGDYPAAVKHFRAVLSDKPQMTRARLELARALMIQGKDKAADYHFRLAQQDRDVPADIVRTIYAARSVIRDRKTWDLSVDIGFAPDTNINNATSNRSVDVLLGGTSLPLSLDSNARRTTGIGQTARVAGSVRLRLVDGLAAVIDADGSALNYDGGNADDISSLLAAGPEWTFDNDSRVTVQGVFANRWYGGALATRSYGLRATMVRDAGATARIQALADVRRVESGIGPGYEGTQFLGSLTWEQVIQRSVVASVTGFARRESLRSDAFSSTEFGLAAGLGGELPFGVNAGLSLTASRAAYDGPLAIFADARRDWRLSGRAYAGARNFRIGGFSPSLTYQYANTRSNLDLYDTSRHRIEFQLARYF